MNHSKVIPLNATENDLHKTMLSVEYSPTWLVYIEMNSSGSMVSSYVTVGAFHL